MTAHDADVAAVMAEVLDPHWREGQVARAEVKLMLAALTKAGIACVYVPEGVEVEHGSRLTLITWPDAYTTTPSTYAIKPPKKGER